MHVELEIDFLLSQPTATAGTALAEGQFVGLRVIEQLRIAGTLRPLLWGCVVGPSIVGVRCGCGRVAGRLVTPTCNNQQRKSARTGESPLDVAACKIEANSDIGIGSQEEADVA
ncbi:hypothetical protein ACWF82_21000 [Nocardia sp. NPDC055053]